VTGGATLARGLLGAALLFGAWEAAVRLFAVPEYILPPVSGILATTVEHRVALAQAAAMTLFEAVSGFVIGSAIGVLLAVLLVLTPPARRMLLPLLVAVNSVPVVAYAPLALLWFGAGPLSKVVMVAFVVGFTVFLNALDGLERVDPAAVNLMRSFGAGRFGVLLRLRLPSALPAIATGMRVSTVRAMIVAIVTEMLGARIGLGWTIYEAVLQIDFLRVWAAILVASVASLALFGLVSWGERRLVFWR
jgi:NitT/TauT family transport system permease protein